MLTVSMQMLMLRMLTTQITAKNNGVYASRAFFRTVTYLKTNNLIQSTRTKENYNEYYLTLKGEGLIRIIASFKDVDQKIRNEFGLF